ncbi:hypothetical protein PGIGA_G00045150 [Pangasianodon gigas]|uniref:Uncharacterized protein n=1 Tax=Pangasianodon gigas TaxID=30993 RepID=A0ACC5X0U2_PANGG|nr:hypothetical protein [Pangasianodon gigas]
MVDELQQQKASAGSTPDSSEQESEASAVSGLPRLGSSPVAEKVLSVFHRCSLGASVSQRVLTTIDS